MTTTITIAAVPRKDLKSRLAFSRLIACLRASSWTSVGLSFMPAA
jgi:hypothetical protein